MSTLFDQETERSDLSLYELFFADGDIVSVDDNLVWKDVLREGEWPYRPGNDGRPVKKPLRIVSGSSDEAGQIGMEDLVSAFDEEAVDHVTVPTSHKDAPDENTGYVRKLRISERDGQKVLQAGIEFTEPDIKDKVIRKSIANTSCGVIFNYANKFTGKIYKAVLGHVALTNKPWINGMKPFGMSEEFSDTQVVSLVSDDVVWNTRKSLNWVKEQVEKSINESRPEEYFVADIQNDRALVSDLDNNGGINKTYVVPFDIHEENISVASEENWVEATKEWVKASEQAYEVFNKNLSADSGAQEAHNNHEGGFNMGEVTNEESTTGETPSNDPAPEAQVTLSEDARQQIAEEIRAEFSEKYESTVEESKKLREKLHAMEVEKRIGELNENFSELPGLLKEVRNIMLADTGESVLSLSEEVEEGSEAKEVSLSASDIVQRLLDVLPKKDGKVDLGEQHLVTDDHDKPSEDSEELDMSEEAIKARADSMVEDLGLGAEYRRKDGDN